MRIWRIYIQRLLLLLNLYMSSYFCEQDIKDFTSPRFILDGATPHVDPKVGSNSDV